MKGVDLTNHTYLSIMRHESEKQIRTEFTAARDIIRKRIKQMEKTGSTGFYQKGLRIKGKMYAGKIDPRDYGFYQKYKDGVPRLRDLTLEQATKELAEMKQWLKAPESTVAGLYQSVKARTAGLRKAGFKGLKSSDLASFGAFMKAYRAQFTDHVPGSPDAAEVYIKWHTRLSDDQMLDMLQMYKDYKNVISKAEEKVIDKLAGNPSKLKEYFEGLK